MYGFWFPVSVFLLIHLFLSDSIGLLSWRTLYSTKFVLSAGNKQINQLFWLAEIQDFFKQIYFARSDWLQNNKILTIHWQYGVATSGRSCIGSRWAMWCIYRDQTWVLDLHPFGVPHTFYCTTCPLVDLRINSNKKFCLSLFPLFHC